jgi:hypothetical protein
VEEKSLTIWYIRNERIEEERPAQRIKQGLLHLVELEVLVTNTLIVHSNALNGKDAVFFAEPAAVHLVVWHCPEEENSNKGSQ